MIELLIGLGIAGMLFMMGIPAFTLWIQNAQNRTAAESIQNGLQLARLESVRRNMLVRFSLTDATGRIAWNVGCVNVTSECPAMIQSRIAADGTADARAGISTTVIPVPAPAGHFDTAIPAGMGLPTGVTFNGMGRVQNIGSDIARIDVTNATSSTSRRYVVTVGVAGQVRMCDPALALADNPQGCS